MASNPGQEIPTLERSLRTLLNKQLQTICQLNGLKTSGNKADLQKRITNALYENIRADPAQYTIMKESIQNMSNRGNLPTGNNLLPGAAQYSSPGRHSTSSPHLSQPSFGQNGFNFSAGRSGFGGGTPASAPQRHALHFKPSPFYVIESMLDGVRTCEVMAQHRNSVRIELKISQIPSLSRCVHDKSLRVMLLCAGDDHGVQDISFPHQAEVKVNGGDVKANMRGLKGKPGSTRPVDITDSLRLDKYAYVNNIEFTYALTVKVKSRNQPPQSRKFYLAVYLCKSIAVEDLVTKIRGKKIPKASVIQELTKAAHDPDVIATSQVLSLKCPLSYTRLRTPCRSMSCSHIQCFDATSYLQLQEQGPQWVCPICNKSATFENLAIDEYAKDILDNTIESTEQVTIEPDGQWRAQGSDEPEPKRPRYSHSATRNILDLDDDEIVPLDDLSSSALSARNTLTPSRSMLSTPAPTSGNGFGSNAKKRPSEVIDLTLSDDDDVPIVRAPKRQNFGTSSSGLGFAPAYQY